MNQNHPGRPPLTICLLLAMLILVTLLIMRNGPKRPAESNGVDTGLSPAASQSLTPATEKPAAAVTTTAPTTEEITTEKKQQGKKEGDQLFIEDEDGTRIPINGWLEIDGKWYYGDTSGTIVKDQVLSIGGKMYYVDTEGVKAVNTTVEFQGIKYVAGEDGTLVTAE